MFLPFTQKVVACDGQNELTASIPLSTPLVTAGSPDLTRTYSLSFGLPKFYIVYIHRQRLTPALYVYKLSEIDERPVSHFKSIRKLILNRQDGKEIPSRTSVANDLSVRRQAGTRHGGDHLNDDGTTVECTQNVYGASAGC